MSERKRRYFLHESGGVYWAARPDSALDYENDRTMTEVQVVPVDAEVAILPALERQGDFWVQPGTKFRVLADWADRTPRLDKEGLDDREAYHLRMAAVVRLTRKERERPPVDEEQVKALVALRDLWDSGDSDHNLWEFMVRHGVRVGAKS